jgi:hypothetical protein
MTPDFTVVHYGIDTSDRPILGTAYMVAVWEAILADKRVAPFAAKIVIVQGAFMSRVPGGGASASAGYHDLAGCWDIRTSNLTAAELDAFVYTARCYGWPFWRRDAEHGAMDPHAHGVLGTDSPLAPGAASQWDDYKAGFDGLADDGPDYERRPSPLVLTPPEETFMLNDADKQWISDAVTAAVKAAVDSNRLDVGKPAKWSDDTVAQTILNRLERIESKLPK